MGAYSRWALIQGWALTRFRPRVFSKEDFTDERTLGSHVHSSSNVEGRSSIFIGSQRMNKIMSQFIR